MLALLKAAAACGCQIAARCIDGIVAPGTPAAKSRCCIVCLATASGLGGAGATAAAAAAVAGLYMLALFVRRGTVMAPPPMPPASELP